jgi:hypothetical protein
MHTLFNLVPRALQGIQHPALWSYVRDGLRANVGQVIRYYRANPQAVKSDHLLVKLIQSVDMSLSLNYERYYSLVDASSLDLSMTLKLTSSLYKGQVWDGVFYGPGSDEVLIVHTDSFDIDKARKDWQNVTPVRVLRHAKSDLYLNLPDGQRNTTESGVSVIAINLPLLMCQYYAFRQAYWIDDKSRHNDSGQIDPRSIMMFIHMYVLPNMLFSHLDQALFNRIHNLADGKPMGQSIKRHPFALIDYSQKVDMVYGQVLGNLRGQEKNLVGILQSVPAAARLNMEEAARLPDMAPTRQVMWALAVSRLPMLDFALGMTHERAMTKNQSEVNEIDRTLYRWKVARIFEGVMPKDVQADVIKELNTILDKANPPTQNSTRLGFEF